MINRGKRFPKAFTRQARTTGLRRFTRRARTTRVCRATAVTAALAPRGPPADIAGARPFDQRGSQFESSTVESFPSNQPDQHARRAGGHFLERLPNGREVGM